MPTDARAEMSRRADQRRSSGGCAASAAAGALFLACLLFVPYMIFTGIGYNEAHGIGSWPNPVNVQFTWMVATYLVMMAIAVLMFACAGGSPLLEPIVLLLLSVVFGAAADDLTAKVVAMVQNDGEVPSNMPRREAFIVGMVATVGAVAVVGFALFVLVGLVRAHASRSASGKFTRMCFIAIALLAAALLVVRIVHAILNGVAAANLGLLGIVLRHAVDAELVHIIARDIVGGVGLLAAAANALAGPAHVALSVTLTTAFSAMLLGATGRQFLLYAHLSSQNNGSGFLPDEYVSYRSANYVITPIAMVTLAVCLVLATIALLRATLRA